MTTKRLVDALSRAHLYVQPSLAEAAPITVLEAMASGLPIVASDIACLPEQVGDAGVLAPPADPSALAAALHALILDPDRRQVLGRRARARIRERFDIRSAAHSHVGLYRRSIEAPAKKPPTWRRASYVAANRLHFEVEPAFRQIIRPLYRRLAPNVARARQQRAKGQGVGRM
jgi:hypothetical protein